jgi:hypothetical protein
MVYASANEKAVSLNLHRYNVGEENLAQVANANVDPFTVGLCTLNQVDS